MKTVIGLAWVVLAGWPAADLLAGVPAPGDPGPWTAPKPAPVYWAHDFVDSVGANTHLLYPESFYARQFDLLKQKLLDVGIRHIRDIAMDRRGEFFSGDQAARFQELGRAGIGVTFIIYHLNVTEQFVQGFPARVSPAFEAYELPNELNLNKSIPWPSAIQAWAPLFYRYVKSNAATASYPVLAPSIGDIGGDPYGELGMQAQYFDYGNLHIYYPRYNPKNPGYGRPGKGQCAAQRYGSLNYALCNLERVSNAKPVICTESGWGTDLTAGNQVSPEVQAKFIARMLLLNLEAGIRRTFIYQFADYGTDGFGAFGLLRSDGSEKPAYVELKRLIGELADTAPTRSPTALTLRSGRPWPGEALTGESRDVQSVLLEKSDGSYRLMLWLEKPAVDPKTGAPLDVPSQRVTLSMPQDYRPRRLLTFENSGAANIKQLPGSSASLDISVSDNLTIIDVAPASMAPVTSGRSPGPNPQ